MTIKKTTLQKVNDLIERYPSLEICLKDLNNAVKIICEGFKTGNKLMICGNGGSAADSLHIVGELMKGFLLPRPIKDFDIDFYDRLKSLCPEDADYFSKNLQCALPAISLVGEMALNTAVANDNVSELIFAQQGDILLAITTSGNSLNVLQAVKVSKVKNLKVIALTGRNGGKIKSLADVSICVPADSAYTIQEYHLPIYHMLCIAAENEFFQKV